MNDKDLVTCLETSKLLKELEFPYDTYWQWYVYINFQITCYKLIRRCDEFVPGILPEHIKYVTTYPAPTTDELLMGFDVKVDIERWKSGNYHIQVGIWESVQKLLPEALAQLWLKVKGENERRSK